MPSTQNTIQIGRTGKANVGLNSISTTLLTLTRKVISDIESLIGKKLLQASGNGGSKKSYSRELNGQMCSGSGTYAAISN